MPGMTGMDLARRMLQLRPDLPIILCTGYSALINQEHRALGIKAFAMNPPDQKRHFPIKGCPETPEFHGTGRLVILVPLTLTTIEQPLFFKQVS